MFGEKKKMPKQKDYPDKCQSYEGRFFSWVKVVETETIGKTCMTPSKLWTTHEYEAGLWQLSLSVIHSIMTFLMQIWRCLMTPWH